MLSRRPFAFLLASILAIPAAAQGPLGARTTLSPEQREEQPQAGAQDRSAQKAERPAKSAGARAKAPQGARGKRPQGAAGRQRNPNAKTRGQAERSARPNRAGAGQADRGQPAEAVGRRAQNVQAAQAQSRLEKLLADPNLPAEQKAKVRAQLDARLNALRAARGGAAEPSTPEVEAAPQARGTDAELRAQNVRATKVQARLEKLLADPNLSAEQKAKVQTQLDARLNALRAARGGAAEPSTPEVEAAPQARGTDAELRAQNVRATKVQARLEKLLADPNLSAEQKAKVQTQLDARLSALRASRGGAAEPSTPEVEATPQARGTDVELRAQNVQATRAQARVEELLADPNLSAEQKAKVQAQLDARLSALRAARGGEAEPSTPAVEAAPQARGAGVELRAQNVQATQAQARVEELLADPNLSAEQKAKVQAQLDARLNALRAARGSEAAPAVEEPAASEALATQRSSFQVRADRAREGLNELLQVSDLPASTAGNLRFLEARIDALRTPSPGGSQERGSLSLAGTRARVRNVLADPLVSDDLKARVRGLFGDPDARDAAASNRRRAARSEEIPKPADEIELTERIRRAQAEVERKLRDGGATQAQIDAQKAAVRDRLEDF